MSIARKLVHSLSHAANNIAKCDTAKARMIYQLHETKELTQSGNRNRQIINKSFDELHARIVDLVRHEKNLLKRQEEDETEFRRLKVHIEHIEHRLKNSERLVEHFMHNTKKIDEIDRSLGALYTKVVHSFDLQHSLPSSPSGLSASSKATKKKSSMTQLKKTMAELEKKYQALKKTSKDTEKLELIRKKIDVLKKKIK